MKIITISGHAGSGKDTAANYIHAALVSPGKRILITHYADLLKYICRTFFRWDGEKDAFGRSLLQRVGTDTVREKDPNYWVNFIISILRFFPSEWDYVIIPDTRFPNEINRLRKAGYPVVHVRVERDGFDNGLTSEQKSHPSETALDQVKPDYILKNNGTKSDFYNIVRIWVKENLHE